MKISLGEFSSFPRKAILALLLFGFHLSRWNGDILAFILRIHLQTFTVANRLRHKWLNFPQKKLVYAHIKSTHTILGISQDTWKPRTKKKRMLTFEVCLAIYPEINENAPADANLAARLLFCFHYQATVLMKLRENLPGKCLRQSSFFPRVLYCVEPAQ